MRRSHSLPSQAHWFDSHQLEGYIPPQTLQSKDLLDPSLMFSNNHLSNPKKTSDFKGGCFNKAPKPALFGKVNKTPGPSQYSQVQTKKVRSVSKKSSGSYSRKKSDSKVESMGVGSYDLQRDILKPSFQQSGTLSKAEKNNYFTHAQYQKDFIPGIGSYDPHKREKNHSLLTLLPKKESLSLGKEKQNKKGKVKPPGPMTYIVKTEQSVGCSAVMKRLLQESDDKIRERVTEMRKNKANSIRAGPGKYLKIEQWGKYSKYKHISNGLNICSKPTIGVYH